MKKLILVLVMAVMLALFAPVYAAEPVMREVGETGDMIAVLEPAGEKTMMELVKYWYENGWPDYMGYVKRGELLFSDYNLFNNITELYADIKAEWDTSGRDLREGEISGIPEYWIIGMKEDTESNRAEISSLVSNPCVFKFVQTDISFNELTEIYAEIVDYARYRLPVYDVNIGECLYVPLASEGDKVYVVVSFLNYDSISEKFARLYGEHVEVISNKEPSMDVMSPGDKYLNFVDYYEEFPISYEIYLLASAALLALTLIVWGIVYLIRGVIYLVRGIKKRRENGGNVSAPKKRVKAWKVFLIVIAAELVVIIAAGAVMTVLHAKSFEETPTINTVSRVVELGKYKNIDYEKTGDTETDGRQIILKVVGKSYYYINVCDSTYIYNTLLARFTAEAEALNMDTETYFDTVMKPELDAKGEYYGSFVYYMFVLPQREAKIRLTAQAVAQKEGISVSREEIAAAGAELGYAEADLTQGSAALEESEAKALLGKVYEHLIKIN